MPATLHVRTFHREDRDQLTTLINVHAAAVVPGAVASVNTVLSSLERSPEEFVTDPWIAERATLVAEHAGRIVAAAHLVRYANDPDVSEDYRDTGHIVWFLHHPSVAEDPGTEQAPDLLMAACFAQFNRWHVSSRHADGRLPIPGVYGVPDQWPHIREVLERAGFVQLGETEILFLARVADLPAPAPAPLPGLTLRRTLGVLGTRLSAVVDAEEIAYIELDTTLDRPERHVRSGGMADVSDLELPQDAHPDLLPWLLGQARAWLTLCGAGRLLAYATHDEKEEIEGMLRHGFVELTRTARGWHHRPA
ncbi:N-acetyltransferase [Streptomyces albipurpureus]|uniref:N-acetyltransferase n=1 Tax=Streptomyces albipurpureus TaxID=2897419 RepID=A0ABT0UNC1_9ACTN|nr:N-acetyltransferase [Streptomyces sp. CWNU-1]MCM2389822.1 N-acetyltransferase [Streptomyces sp. CWNU-1]